jgi:arginine/lysine/ornithine decarboxylase
LSNQDDAPICKSILGYKAKAVGEIAAETVTPYPPGIPRLVPGELITKKLSPFCKKQ